MSPSRRNILCLTVLTIFATSFFRLPAPAQTPEQSVIHVNVNLVLLDATVKTKAGQILGDLKQDSFELREDGVPQKIEIFSRDELPLNVALVLDLSDSIGPFLGPLRQAAMTALADLKPEDQVALFTFATEAEMKVPFTTDKTEIAQQISAFHVGGATNINDGIFVAAKYLLNTPPKGRRIIILISDDVGTDAGGQGTHDIITECIASDAVLYNLKIPGYNPPGTLFAASMVPGLVNIRKVMDQTGGEIFDVQDVAHLDAGLVQRVAERHLHQFQMRDQARAIFGRQGGKQVVLARVMSDWHERSLHHQPRPNKLGTRLKRMVVASPDRPSDGIMYDTVQTRQGFAANTSCETRRIRKPSHVDRLSGFITTIRSGGLRAPIQAPRCGQRSCASGCAASFGSYGIEMSRSRLARYALRRLQDWAAHFAYEARPK
jgi:VWFA-related protein